MLVFNTSTHHNLLLNLYKIKQKKGEKALKILNLGKNLQKKIQISLRLFQFE